MQTIRLVMGYTGMNYKDVLNLPCDLFMLCRKNAIVEQLMKTEQGREYLQDCENAKHTKPDFEGLKRLQQMMR